MEKSKELNPLSGNKAYRDQLVTLGDLQEFKDDLLVSFKSMLLIHSLQPTKKWLKSYEVKKFMNISAGTLQTLRNNGTLPHTKIGGLIYYDTEEINRIMAGHKFETRLSNRPILEKIRKL